MHPVSASFEPFVIRRYGVMIAFGCLAGLWLARKEADRNGISKEKNEEFVHGKFGKAKRAITDDNFTEQRNRDGK